MSTGEHVNRWLALCESVAVDGATTRGTVAALLVIAGYCATRHEAHRYVTALLSN